MVVDAFLMKLADERTVRNWRGERGVEEDR